METLTTFFTALAGLAFSVAIGLLAEELIFGKVLCPIFARHAARVKTAQQN